MVKSVYDNGGYIGYVEKYPFVPIVKNGLVLHLDAGDTASYPGAGTTWYDLSGNGYHFTVQSGSWVRNDQASHFDFTGAFCCAKRVVSGALSNVPSSTTNTLMVFSTIIASSTNYRTLIRGAAEDHQVIVNIGSNNIGYWNNTPGTAGFNDSSYSITNIPSYTSGFNCLHWKFTQSSPYWTFGFNNSFNVSTITNVLATNDYGFASIGAYHGATATVSSSADASQYWGKIAVFLYYNRTLSDAEITQNFNSLRSRFAV